MTRTATPIQHPALSHVPTIGDPDVAGPLAVFPLFGPAPRLNYLAFVEAVAHGVTVSELPQGASVNNLLVTNSLDDPVLLYEGEELLGAQQNRTVDAAVLVPARSKLTVPVSCVEQNRWDGGRHGEAFAPSPQAAYPRLRAAKSARIRARIEAALEPRADQGEVWHELAALAVDRQASAPTGAMSDIYEHGRDRVAQLCADIRRHDGQTGALVALGGRFAVADMVSRSDAFAALFGPLLKGYALDAIDHSASPAPARSEAEDFLARAFVSRIAERPAVGLGGALALTGVGVGGTGLTYDGELVQLSAYAGEQGPSSEAVPGQRTRIRRPSRRAR